MSGHLSNVANVGRWEWFKLRRRWMPWVLLLILVAFSQLFLWGNFFSYRGMEQQPGPQMGFREPGGPEITLTCREVLENPTPEAPAQFIATCEQWAEQHDQQLERMRASFTLPGSLPASFSIAQNIGLLLIAILTASLIGTEYSWGTLRSSLVRGSGRWQYLSAKLGLLALLSGAALLAVALVTVASSVLAGLIEGGSIVGSGAEAQWTDLGDGFVRSWFGLLPYIALAAAVTVLTGSSSAGIGISLAYNFTEGIGTAILINLFEWFETVADYLLGRNISAWMAAGPEGSAGGGINLGALIGDFPGQWHAFAVILVYMLILGGAAFRVFQHRDVRGANGG